MEEENRNMASISSDCDSDAKFSEVSSRNKSKKKKSRESRVSDFLKSSDTEEKSDEVLKAEMAREARRNKKAALALAGTAKLKDEDGITFKHPLPVSKAGKSVCVVNEKAEQNEEAMEAEDVSLKRTRESSLEGKTEKKTKTDTEKESFVTTGVEKLSDVVEVKLPERTSGIGKEIFNFTIGNNIERLVNESREVKIVKDKIGQQDSLGVLKRVGVIKDKMVGLIAGKNIDPVSIGEIIIITHDYEKLVFEIACENERLRGRLEEIQKSNIDKKPMSVLTATPIPAPRKGKISVPQMQICGPMGPLPKMVPTSQRLSYAQSLMQVGPLTTPPVFKQARKTFALQISANEKGTSKEAQKKIVEEIAPALGVRVHAIEKNKTGCRVLFPTSRERDLASKNEKIQKEGLTAEIKKDIGPKLIVRRVNRMITSKEFLGELHKLNLESLTPEEFKNEVKLITPPWEGKLGKDDSLNVILECSYKVAKALRNVGRCYIKHYSYRVDDLPLVKSCYRCLSLDHVQNHCKANDIICKRCGQMGHYARSCRREVHCRDCAFKGYPAGHDMLTLRCPIYKTAVDRAVSKN